METPRCLPAQDGRSVRRRLSSWRDVEGAWFGGPFGGTARTLIRFFAFVVHGTRQVRCGAFRRLHLGLLPHPLPGFELHLHGALDRAFFGERYFLKEYLG